MGTLDIVLLICFVPAVVRGIQKGFIEQIVSIASIFIGVWAAFRFTQPLSVWLAGYINADAKLLHIISFVVVVVLAVILLNLLGRLLTKTVKLASLGWLNRILGLVFAILKAALIIGLLVFVFDSLNVKWNLIDPGVLKDSVVYNALRDAALKVFPYLKDLIINA